MYFKNYSELFNKIDTCLTEGNLFICISGYSCSGKTTLAKEIVDKYFELKPLILCEDLWYKNLDNIPKKNMGFFSAFDMEGEKAFWIDEFYSDVAHLIYSGECYIPVYDIYNNIRVSKNKKVLSSQLVIIEGLHTIDIFKDLDKVCNVLYVMLDTDIDTCVNRRISRDISLCIKRDVIIRHYREVIVPNYEEWYIKQKNIIFAKQDRGFILN